MGRAGHRSIRRWVLGCAVAEAVGLTAAASAATGVAALADRPGVLGGVTVALALVVAGGLVEGLALGTVQGGLLAERWPGLRRGVFVVVTTLVAGLGWAVGSAPGVLAVDDGGPEPALWLVLAGAAGIGLVMGPVLGGAQALVLRAAVQHARRWVLANTVAWPPVMVVIFLGATRPEADWSAAAVVVTGTLTGLVAGAVLGLLTAPWLARLDRPSDRGEAVPVASEDQHARSPSGPVPEAVGRKSERA